MNSFSQVKTGEYKKGLRKVIYIFIGGMLFLTFFSNTINNLMLPEVHVSRPQSGILTKKIEGEGVLKAKEIYEQYTGQNLKVTEVLLKAGEKVNKNQLILKVDLEDMEKELSRKKIELEQSNNSLRRLTESKSYLEKSYERNIDAKKRSLAIEQENLENAKVLYDRGAESADNVRKAEASVSDAEKQLAATQDEGKKDITDLGLEIANLRLDIQLQKIVIEDIKKEIAELSSIKAPCDGIVIEVGYSKGALTSSTKSLFKIADLSKGFELSIDIDRDKATYLSVGEEIPVYLSTSGEIEVNGRISAIKDHQEEENLETIDIDIDAEGLKGGEHSEIHLSRETPYYNMTIPSLAVHEDGNGTFVFVLKSEKGPLGNEYFIQRANVSYVDDDGTNTAVSSGLILLDRIVVSSDKQLHAGSRVRLLESNEQ